MSHLLHDLLGAATLAGLTAGTHYGYRIVRGYAALATRERLAQERARRLGALLAVTKAEQEATEQLVAAALQRDGDG